jgi:hypothetical protein
MSKGLRERPWDLDTMNNPRVRILSLMIFSEEIRRSKAILKPHNYK